jgi:hypothetical protein
MNKLLIVTAALIAGTNALALDIVSCKALNDSGLSVEVTYLDGHSDRQIVTLQLHQPTKTSEGKIRIAPTAKVGFFEIIRESDNEVIGQCPTALSLRIERDASDAKDKSDH